MTLHFILISKRNELIQIKNEVSGETKFRLISLKQNFPFQKHFPIDYTLLNEFNQSLQYYSVRVIILHQFNYIFRFPQQ